MGLMDAFTADARVELKVGDLYDMLRVSANNEASAKFLLNAVKCEVPYNFIREIVTGEKEDHDEMLKIEIPRDLINKAMEEAAEMARAAAGQGGDHLRDCNDEDVACEDCPAKEFCEKCAAEVEAAAAGQQETETRQQDGDLPFEDIESEGGKA